LLDYGKAEIRLVVRTDAQRRRLRSCFKEPWTVRWIEQWLRPGEVMWDVGANVGAYSLIAAKVTGGRAQVIALEPGFSTYAALCENVVLNGEIQCVKPLPLALAAGSSIETLCLQDLQAGAALHAFGTDEVENGFPQPVIAYTADSAIRDLGLPAPHHVKLDVDGPELDVIEGARQTLASAGVRSLLVELDAALEEQIGAVLAEIGYVRRHRWQRERPGPVKPPAYGLFLPEDSS
jgi:FkbM family methyltransferase